ncbi:MAG: leucine--tRNA ligase [Candidatus Cloacimonetes bacterium]|nr:leucine--tRNA ligase [Candidatus Cloacimonadota bacterium]
MEYNFTEIEKKWQKKWAEAGVFNAENNSKKPKYYVLSMFPYPSGPLHMGHASNYSIGDAITRYKMQQGYNVLQPIGYDSFGMPAENFAILNNSHPSITTENNIKIMREQFQMLGIAIDWSRELATSRSNYYHWGQWLFKKLYENGLVYRKSSWVNWCDECQTVLANEQVEDNKCWRCDSEVRQKDLVQWFFRITKYAEELLDFSKVIDWPERVKAMQTNWIGKSHGTEVDFPLENSEKVIKVFTTRPDTLFGVTFMALPPEHPLVTQWLTDPAVKPDLASFCQKVINEDKIARSSADTTKEGIFSGHYCLNPVNGDRVQVWITNYVLMDYGTGAVMAVPAHDQRDFEFAKKYQIDMKLVINKPDSDLVLAEMTQAYTEEGVLVNSGEFSGLPSEQSKEKITSWLAEKSMGNKTVTYRLRDWGISRQRYWGNPIPVVHCEKCGIVLVPDADLPVQLPMNVQVGKTTQNPLLSVDDWVNTPCPKCGAPARRETDTMDTFVDSSWYFARYTDPQNDKAPFDINTANYWLPVDQYIGGIEHACMHLMYARFFHKFMRDIKLVSSDEPFARLLTQGMVLKDGYKMSKSKGNTVDPQEFIDRYGADTIRVFVLFASPPEKDVEWSDDGVKGAFRFLNRLWVFFQNLPTEFKKQLPTNSADTLQPAIKDLRYSTHYTIKFIKEDYEQRMQFNTNIAALMEHFNLLFSIKDTQNLNTSEKDVYRQACLILPILLYPYAPHLAEELWEICGHTSFVHEFGELDYDPKFLQKDEVTYVVQINGKIRGKVEVSADATDDAVKQAAMQIDNVAKSLEGQTIKKIIVVKGKLVSIVI